ncbi:DNA cytosine methyltransferase [Streptomyces sp. NPDC002490]|uniref:DNA cytosine methyltransferase n=1 Tax=Streptomyces sp. NPDC002490 TaxID=3154416 RepID=UPI0033260C80
MAAEPPASGGRLIGSLCSGYGGLDLSVQSVLGGRMAWHADTDPGASRILARHWPSVPNLGDISTVDWATVPEVCVLTAGFPCQRRLGRRSPGRAARGHPSGLWHHVARAIEVLQPCLVVIENVRGLLNGLGTGGLAYSTVASSPR